MYGHNQQYVLASHMAAQMVQQSHQAPVVQVKFALIVSIKHQEWDKLAPLKTCLGQTLLLVGFCNLIRVLKVLHGTVLGVNYARLPSDLGYEYNTRLSLT